MRSSARPYKFLLVAPASGCSGGRVHSGILYIAGNWFPEQYRGRVLSLLLVCNPIAATLGEQISGWLLQMNGVWGLAGWQWIFIVEGVPASFLALIVIWILPNRIEQAHLLRKRRGTAVLICAIRDAKVVPTIFE
ncbi:MFS transporter [Burkholderia sp. 8Y]|uniref:MFS transporter n=1 Tax=Burkholderia sp. 8Y TaxID=2653133 RepID=UPI0013591C04